MEALLALLFWKLSFFASGLGLIVIGAVATSIILFWEWRWAFISLLVVQTGVCILVMNVHGAPQDWAALQIIVMALCVLLLALSAQQIYPAMSKRRPGSWLLRGMALLLLLASWQIFNLKLALPLISPKILPLFLWLGLCTLVLLSLSDDAFFTGIALLLWCIPVQAMIEILLPMPQLFILVNILEIMLALACSYLVLTGRAPVPEEQVTTDLTFTIYAEAPPTFAGYGENGMNGDHTLAGSSPTQRALPPELAAEYPFAVEGSQ